MTEERYKQLMEQLGMPQSHSLLQALQQAVMEATLDEREACAKLAEGWPDENGEYQTCGNGRFWDAGNVYDQARVDAAAAIRHSR